jgi:phosphoribosylformimino-5-aminoimidazole carboxamide ribotide isomerase
MLIIPAIDLKDKAVVRFIQGRFAKKVYSLDPVKVARSWVSQGAKFLHLVDLDGAFSGKQRNLCIVRRIIREVKVPVELGGGIRSESAVSKALDIGVARVILGTKAVEDRAFLKKAFSKFGKRIIVGVDAKAGEVMIRGWRAGYKNTPLLEYALFLKELGFKEFIFTDTLKDGTLTGPNIRGLNSLLKSTGLKIIASGGVSRIADLKKLKALEKDGLSGVIIGKALYEGKFSLGQALKYS